MAGLRTVSLGEVKVVAYQVWIDLTHCDDIRVGLVHSDIVLLGLMKTNLHPELENLILRSKVLPFGHEHFEIEDSTG